jgi:hypothetical protein
MMIYIIVLCEHGDPYAFLGCSTKKDTAEYHYEILRNVDGYTHEEHGLTGAKDDFYVHQCHENPMDPDSRIELREYSDGWSAEV